MTTNIASRCLPALPGTQPDHAHCRSEACGCPCGHPGRPTTEGVGTGAGEGATGQDTGTAWVTRSVDCPEAPAQAHPFGSVEAEEVEG